MNKEMLIRKGKEGRISNKVIAGILLLSILFCGILYVAFGGESKDENQIQGSIKMKEINVNSKLPGMIEEIKVEEGDEVKKGDVLMVLASDTVEAKLMQAESAKAAAEAQSSKAQSGARQQEVAQAKAAYEYAEKTYLRMKTLLEQEAISRASFDQVEAQYNAAKEVYAMAMEGARKEDKAAAAALVNQASGAVLEVNSYLNDTVIKAPQDGIVTALNVNEGELISTGMPLACVTNMETPWVEINISETKLDQIRIGDEVTVRVPAYEKKEFKGKIIKVNKKPDFATKRATNENGDFDVLSYGVKVKLSKNEEALYPNMTAFVDLSKVRRK